MERLTFGENMHVNVISESTERFLTIRKNQWLPHFFQQLKQDVCENVSQPTTQIGNKRKADKQSIWKTKDKG
jgi:hypothetical protein